MNYHDDILTQELLKSPLAHKSWKQESAAGQPLPRAPATGAPLPTINSSSSLFSATSSLPSPTGLNAYGSAVRSNAASPQSEEGSSGLSWAPMESIASVRGSVGDELDGLDASLTAAKDPFAEKENFSWGLRVLTTVFDTEAEQPQPQTTDAWKEPLLEELSLGLGLGLGIGGATPTVPETPAAAAAAAAPSVTAAPAVRTPEQEAPATRMTALPSFQFAAPSATATSSAAASPVASASPASSGVRAAEEQEEQKTGSDSPSSSVGHSTGGDRWPRDSSGPSTPLASASDVVVSQKAIDEAVASLAARDAAEKKEDAKSGIDANQKTIYMVGIDSATSDEHILTRLSQFGSIRKYQLCGDPAQPTRYGFFEYNTAAGCSAAQSLDQKKMFDRPVRVSKAKGAIKGGRIIPDAHQAELLKSAGVCIAQGLEAPTGKGSKDGRADFGTSRRHRRGGDRRTNDKEERKEDGRRGGGGGGGGNGNVRRGRGEEEEGVRTSSEKESMFASFRARPPTSLQPSKDGEKVGSPGTSPATRQEGFGIKPIWSRRK
eukprot:Rhum_TRINITY_DN14930_c14_g1::Rhum_TRINITY_DN14930_c14_g1_i1::g.128948::m.128948